MTQPNADNIKCTLCGGRINTEKGDTYLCCTLCPATFKESILSVPNADKLRGCPFCGAEAGISKYNGTKDNVGKRFVAVWASCTCVRDQVKQITPASEVLTEDQLTQLAVEAWNKRYTHPAPRGVGKDVVEAMAKAFNEKFYQKQDWDHFSPTTRRYTMGAMQAALTAAEALGYTFTKQDRVLPELPEGWELIAIDAKTIGDDALYTCEINQFIGLDRIDGVVLEGKTWQAAYRAAVLAGIAKVQK